MRFFDVTPVGRIMNRFSSDLYCVDDSLPFQTNRLVMYIFSGIGKEISCFNAYCVSFDGMNYFINRYSYHDHLRNSLVRFIYFTDGDYLLPAASETIAFLHIWFQFTDLHFWFQKYYRFTTVALKRISSVSLSPVYSHFSDTLVGVMTIRAFRAVGRSVAHFTLHN